VTEGQRADSAPPRGRRPSGRRPSGADTRAAIFEAARGEFAAKGFDATSMRGVAKIAGVDPALVHHYFAGKVELFTETIVAYVTPAVVVGAMVTGPREELGRRLVTGFFGFWDGPDARETFAALFRSAATNPALEAVIPAFLGREILPRLQAAYEIDHAEHRIGMVAAQLIGLALMRYVVRLPAVTAMSVAELASVVGPTMQRYLTGDLGPG